jgi:enediyne biosynthesis protein E4
MNQIRMRWKEIVAGALLFASMFACSDQKKEQALFNQIGSEQSGIDFTNSIFETDSFNVLNFEYIYNGAGVGVGDVNGDGLLDIYLGGNMVSSKLYINAGNFVFKDVTEQAKVSTSEWCTGISMIDINQDGKLDIHVSTITPKLNGHSKNLFFLNQGNDQNGTPVFAEMAKRLGVADSSYSTQTAFFDYDLDGDLDMYLLTNANEFFIRSNPIGQHHDGTGRSVDKLYQNLGNDSTGYPRFKDVSVQAGILSEGWGLGIVINDINRDGYPDVYVANDFMSNDHMYINNRNGTFTDESRQRLKHQEMNGMGVDMADLNNDGLNDIVAVDMLPEDNLRQKTMFSDIGYDRFQLALQKKYQPQYVRNVLQVNNGNGTFSDIGYFSGIEATDWSWSPLIADFDNDGWRDIFITNGYVKDVTDLDFGVYAKEAAIFGTKEARLQKLIAAANKLEGIDKPNVLFHNNQDLTFTNTAKEWGLAVPSYSNGAAYGDLDNDGDLDLIINTVNSESLLFENKCNALTGNDGQQGTHNFLRINLAGDKGNNQGVGATVALYFSGKKQFAEQSLQRGYKSTVEPYLHFGLGNHQMVDSIIVEWPGFRYQKLVNVSANQVITVNQVNSRSAVKIHPKYNPIFNRIDPTQLNVSFTHQENDFVDFKTTPLLPRKHSRQGPAICAGDVNGDLLSDFILGGPANQSAVVFTQTKTGTFTRSEIPNKTEEDTGMLLFDADGDGDLDLYCVSGSSEFGTDMKNYRDRFYLNDGKGAFKLSLESIPATQSSGSCVIGQDYDKDGDVDLFIGGRIVPGRYPSAPESYILQNDGHGKFSNVTESVAPQLKNAGMITSAIWTDFNNDGWTDILAVGEFMPITFFENNGGKKFVSSPDLVIKNSAGWWNSVTGGDFDNDGDIDYALGNLGLNSRYKASVDEPVCVYAKDYDENGSFDPVMSRFINGTEYPVHPRETMTSQIVGMRRVLRSYEIYGKTPLHDLFSSEMVKGAYILQATEFRSCLLENLGTGFALKPLPDQVQYSPVFGILARDINKDGNVDLICVGNDYSTETLNGYYDAGIGNCLLGDGKGNFESLDVNASGFLVDRDAKAMVTIPVQGKELFIVTQNSDSLVAFTYRENDRRSFIELKQSDLFAEFYLKNRLIRKTEFYFGESYLSQSTRTMEIPHGVDKVVIVNSRNEKRTIDVSRDELAVRKPESPLLH